MAGHLFVEWIDVRCAKGKRKAPARDAAAQQSRRNVYGCDGESWGCERAMGIRRCGCGLRQRRLAGYLRFEFWQEPALSQQSRWDVYRCRGKGGSCVGRMVNRRDVGRL